MSQPSRSVGRFEDGKEWLKQAHALAAASSAEIAAAQTVYDEAGGDFWAAGQQLAHLLLLLIRYALRHEPDDRGISSSRLSAPSSLPAAQAVAKAA